MGTTTNKALRYPASTDNVRIWEHVQNLANDVDGAFGAGLLLVANDYYVATGAVTLTTIEQVITGLSKSITTHTAGAILKVTAGIFFSAATGASVSLFGRLYVDNVQITGDIRVALPTTGEHGTYSKTWKVSGLATGAHTVEVRVIRGSGTTGIVANAGDSYLDLALFE